MSWFLKCFFKSGISVSNVLNSPTLAAWHQIVSLCTSNFLKIENLLLRVWSVSFFVYNRTIAAGIINNQAQKRNKLYLSNELHPVFFCILDHALQWKLCFRLVQFKFMHIILMNIYKGM